MLVAALTLIAFLPALFGDFLSWDDDRNFLDNHAYRGIGWRQISWMLTTFHMGHYKPVTWLTHGIDYVLWGMSASGPHLTSLLLHAATAVAFLFLARRLLSAALPPGTSEPALRLGAAGAALLFSVHPLRVEPVTWLTGRGDLLSGLLAILAVLAYLRACDRAPAGTGGGQRWYWGSVALFALALLSKSMVLTLPLVLLVLDVYPLRRLASSEGAGERSPSQTSPKKGCAGKAGARHAPSFKAAYPDRLLGAEGSGRGLAPRWRGVVLEKIPFLLLSAAAAAVTLLARLEFGSMQTLAEIGFRYRLGAALYGLGFYLWKSVVPVHLSPLYEFGATMKLGGVPLPLSGTVVVAMTLLAVILRRRWPGLTAAWVTYVVMLLPVSGLFQNGPQIAADRYTYLACAGWALLAGAGLARCAQAWARVSSGRWLQGSAIGSAGAAVIALAGLSAWQTLVWQDSLTLWTHAVKLQPTSAVSQSGLGMVLLADGQMEEAGRRFEQAIRLAPLFPEARMGLAFTLASAGRHEDAVTNARIAVSQSRHDARFHVALAETLKLQGRASEALATLWEAARLEPRAPFIWYAMAVTLAQAGETEAAHSALEHGRHLAREAGLSEREADRSAAIMATASDPARAAAAWEKYLTAMSELRNPSRNEMRAMLRGLIALEALRSQAAPVASR